MPITDRLLLNPGILKDLQILVVDNDRDSRDLYGFLLESHGAKVTALGSIKDTLEHLDGYIPNLLICEMRFSGESVLPLIHKIRSLALNSGITIPILGTSTCSLGSLMQQLQVKIEAYLLKPIDLDHLVDTVWSLALLPSGAFLPSLQNYATQAIASCTTPIAESVEKPAYSDVDRSGDSRQFPGRSSVFDDLTLRLAAFASYRPAPVRMSWPMEVIATSAELENTSVAGRFLSGLLKDLLQQC